MADDHTDDDSATVQAPPKPAAKRKAPKRGRTRSKHDAERIASVEKQRQALEYRKLGLTYAQIGEKLSMTAQGAFNAIESALKRVLREPAESVRSIELERLDAMFIPVYGNACRGDLQAIATAITIMGRRAKLLGLDAPTVLTGKDGQPLVLNAAPPSLTFTFVGAPHEAAPAEGASP